ncbi:YchJ family protein [Dyadobacter tibetensis]|uniref:YchJ family protein n=1 Tax=Dyadobacter tibetensis TaxID=1211851 RepID=UPI0004725EE7|nr:YchJ family metal-binding protein [Dyadobacter tibetensis]
MGKKCYCGQLKPFSACCASYIRGELLAESPEILMRSRYSAYVTGAIEYLVQTTAPELQGALNIVEIQKWARENTWKMLEVLSAEGNEVEFKAHYRDRNGKLVVHHERSRFIYEAGRWFYQDGDFY